MLRRMAPQFKRGNRRILYLENTLCVEFMKTELRHLALDRKNLIALDMQKTRKNTDKRILKVNGKLPKNPVIAPTREKPIDIPTPEEIQDKMEVVEEYKGHKDKLGTDNEASE